MPASDLVHNERVKYAATFMNGVGLAVVVTGAVAPVLGSLLGLAATSASVHLWPVLGASLGMGLALHLGALAVLGRLR